MKKNWWENIEPCNTAKLMQQFSFIDTDGYPRNKNSFFIELSRDNIPDFSNKKENEEIRILCKNKGKKETLHAKFVKNFTFPDGITVVLDPIKNSFLGGWGRYVLWLPNKGHCGILKLQTPYI